MADKGANPDAVIARIAARQHGIVSTGQLEEAGVSREMASTRAASGRLHRVHQGVYAVGHRGLSREGRWMAAVLACGKGAALSHRSSAAHWKLLDPVTGPVEVSVPGTGGRHRRRGIRIHRRLSLSPSAVTRRDNIPVTTPAQTIADLRGAVSPGGGSRADNRDGCLGAHPQRARGALSAPLSSPPPANARGQRPGRQPRG